MTLKNQYLLYVSRNSIARVLGFLIVLIFIYASCKKHEEHYYTSTSETGFCLKIKDKRTAQFKESNCNDNLSFRACSLLQITDTTISFSVSKEHEVVNQSSKTLEEKINFTGKFNGDTIILKKISGFSDSNFEIFKLVKRGSGR